MYPVSKAGIVWAKFLWCILPLVHKCSDMYFLKAYLPLERCIWSKILNLVNSSPWHFVVCWVHRCTPHCTAYLIAIWIISIFPMVFLWDQYICTAGNLLYDITIMTLIIIMISYFWYTIRKVSYTKHWSNVPPVFKSWLPGHICLVSIEKDNRHIW